MGDRENTIELIKDHLQRADKSLRAAKKLFEADLLEDTISRAYYATFHAMKALITSIGEESSTHRGLQHVIYTHFVKSDIIENQLHKKISHLLTFRGEADYGVIPIFDKQEAKEAIQTAEETIKVATNWLDNRYNDTLNV